jgi:carbon-monoxide dehydrogenase medium subunit
VAPFELAEPRTLHEAIALLDPEDTGVRPFSGGTALMLMMKAGVLRPTRLVSLQKIGLSEIKESGKGELCIGAMARLSDIERSPVVKRGWPVFAKTLRTLSNVRVRNVATLGGHLAHADPHMDLPPILSALGARVTIAGPGGERSVPLDSIYTGYLETSLKRNELITGIEVPPLAGRRAAYMKCTTRSADDWPALGVAVAFDFRKQLIDELKIVIGAATDRPTRLLSAEKVLQEKNPDEKVLKQAGEAAAGEVRIEGDMHGSAAYKKQLLRIYLGRAINEARK